MYIKQNALYFNKIFYKVSEKYIFSTSLPACVFSAN